MRKKRINKMMIIAVLFLFMAMGIGYSYLSKMLGVSGNVTVKPDLTICKENRGISADGKLCKRAQKLHSEKCNRTDPTYYCSGAGYTLGDNIIYGNCGTSGELKVGDAFDCDVDGNGVYDSNTERFYYVSDYYDTEMRTFNNNYATLIYYNNVQAGIPDNKANFTYSLNAQNFHGPVDAYEQLPRTDQWSKVTLLRQTRQILNEKAGTNIILGGGTLEKFDYIDRAARFLTVQEIEQGCEITTVGSLTVGEIDNLCEFLIENTKYADGIFGSYGIWLETTLEYNDISVWRVHGINRYISSWHSDAADQFGVRPAIDVLKTDILY